MPKVDDVRVQSIRRLSTPLQLKEEKPVPAEIYNTVARGREVVEDILTRRDGRLLVIAGPCSIHDPAGALDYARRLAALREELQDHLEIFMRVYFEKPRTTIGWKGLVSDPHLDGSDDIEAGLRLARHLLLEINALGLPTATEFLDPITTQYLADLVSWAAIGARTAESQTHRQMASGLSMPVGFKNGTDGELQTALDAMQSAHHAHSFLGVDQEGRAGIVHTTGNPLVHVVLRGGRKCPNYDPEIIADAARRLNKMNLPAALMVDCSHANSGKKHTQQERVWHSVLQQRANDETSPIIGVMLESNIHAGSQPFPVPVEELKYGVSITDACVGWEETEALLREAADVGRK